MVIYTHQFYFQDRILSLEFFANRYEPQGVSKRIPHTEIQRLLVQKMINVCDDMLRPGENASNQNVIYLGKLHEIYSMKIPFQGFVLR